MPTDPTRLPTLDGWRAISIAIVLISHLYYTEHPANIDAALSGLVGYGSLGVRIFFVISGLLITYLLIQEGKRASEISLKNFYLRRAFRILPVYFAYLGAIAILQIAGLVRENPTSWFGSLTFTRNMVGQGDSATVHLWSLSIEEQFYLAWPPLFAALQLFRRPRLACSLLGLAILASVVGRATPCAASYDVCSRVLHDHGTLAHIDCLAVGAIAAFVLSARSSTPLPHWSFPIASVGGFIALVFVQPLGQPSHVWSLYFAAVAGLIAASLYFTVRQPANWVSRVLNTAPFKLAGVLSYSIYIWHVLFLADFAPDTPFARSPLAGWLVWWIPAVLVAGASYYWLERPLVGLRRRFTTSQPSNQGVSPFGQIKRLARARIA